MENTEYNAMVDKYLAEDSTAVFGNFSPNHASYIISRFLESAERSVEILSGNFPDAFYEQIGIDALLAETVARIRNNHGRVRIITAGGPVSTRLRQFATQNSDVVSYSPARYNGQNPLQHFMVIDGKRYRLEDPHESTGGIPQCVKAEVCCNGRIKANQLLGYFNHVWELLNPQTPEVAGA